MRILVVEDEHRIARAIKQGLEEERFAVDLAHDGSQALDLATTESYDAIVLDLMLPKFDGLEVTKRLRTLGNHTPILILTARGELQDKVMGLNTGADDYLPKPFAFEELLARLRALVRRPASSLPNLLRVADLVLDPVKYLVTRARQPLKLSKKEFSLLEYLMRHSGRVLSKDQLIAHVWDYEADVLPNTVEVNIRNLRRKLGQPELIQTIRGFGYKIG